MNVLWTVVLFFYRTNLFAAEPTILTLDIVVQIEDEPLSRPTLSINSGDTASIESLSKDGEGFVIEVTPTLQNTNQVQMSFIVTKINKDTRTILSSPQIITLLDQSATITQKHADSSEPSLSLSVTPSLQKENSL